MNNISIQKSFYEYYANLYKRHDIPLQKIDEHLRKQKCLKIVTNCECNFKTGLYITFRG